MMKLIDSQFRVIRYKSRNSCYQIQRLQKVTKVFGFTVFVCTVAQEEIPVWALAQLGCLGYTDWKSKLLRMSSRLNKTLA